MLCRQSYSTYTAEHAVRVRKRTMVALGSARHSSQREASVQLQLAVDCEAEYCECLLSSHEEFLCYKKDGTQPMTIHIKAEGGDWCQKLYEKVKTHEDRTRIPGYDAGPLQMECLIGPPHGQTEINLNKYR